MMVLHASMISDSSVLPQLAIQAAAVARLAQQEPLAPFSQCRAAAANPYCQSKIMLQT